MPVNLIDIVTIAPKSQEASITQSNANRHNVHVQEQAQSQLAKDIQRDAHQTVETEKNQLAKYRDGQSKGSAGYRQNDKRKSKEEKEKEQPKAPASNSTFDIMI